MKSFHNLEVEIPNLFWIRWEQKGVEVVTVKPESSDYTIYQVMFQIIK